MGNKWKKKQKHVAIVHIVAHSCLHGSFGCQHNNNCNNCKMIRKLVLALQSCISRHNFCVFCNKNRNGVLFFFDLKVFRLCSLDAFLLKPQWDNCLKTSP